MLDQLHQELVGNTNFRPLSRCIESKTLRVGQNNLCFLQILGIPALNRVTPGNLSEPLEPCLCLRGRLGQISLALDFPGASAIPRQLSMRLEVNAPRHTGVWRCRGTVPSVAERYLSLKSSAPARMLSVCSMSRAFSRTASPTCNDHTQQRRQGHWNVSPTSIPDLRWAQRPWGTRSKLLFYSKYF